LAPLSCRPQNRAGDPGGALVFAAAVSLAAIPLFLLYGRMMGASVMR